MTGVTGALGLTSLEQRYIMHSLCQRIDIPPWRFDMQSYVDATFTDVFSDWLQSDRAASSAAPRRCPDPSSDPWAYVVILHTGSDDKNTCRLWHVLSALAEWSPQPPRITLLAHPEAAVAKAERLLHLDPELACLEARTDAQVYPELSDYQAVGHRGLVGQGFRQYPAARVFAYIEDDIVLNRRHLAAWERDNALLEPLGLTRGFQRFERPFAGLGSRRYLIDQRGPQRVSERPRVLVGGREYVGLDDTYHGFWVLSRSQVEVREGGQEDLLLFSFVKVPSLRHEYE